MLDELLEGDLIKSSQHVPVITISTDASWSARYKVGAWACYIRTDEKLVKYGAVIKADCTNSSDAERIGIANALWITNRIANIKDARIILYCDNKSAVKSNGVKNKNSKKRPAARTRLSFYQQNIERYFNQAKFVDIRHVRSHQPRTKRDNQLKRYFMNDWCDSHARSLLKEYCGKLKA